MSPFWILLLYFYFEIITDSQESAKKKVRNGLVYSSPYFPHGYILHNYYTTWKPGIWHWYNVCIKLYVILWHVNSCNYHCKQDTELFYHHSIRKGLGERIPSYLLGEHVNWFSLNREQYSNIFLKLKCTTFWPSISLSRMSHTDVFTHDQNVPTTHCYIVHKSKTLLTTYKCSILKI